MNDEKNYMGENNEGGWTRQYLSPQASFDVNIDPFSQQQFIEKTGKTDGQKMGDLYDRSAELSAKRAEKRGGVDKVKTDYYASYRSKRKGKPHAREIRERTDKLEITI